MTGDQHLRWCCSRWRWPGEAGGVPENSAAQPVRSASVAASCIRVVERLAVWLALWSTEARVWSTEARPGQGMYVQSTEGRPGQQGAGECPPHGLAPAREGFIEVGICSMLW
jgi:hypothetical protein